MSTIKTPVFEHVTCTRCGGSGKYSFNLMHGSRCYGCSGTGYSLTKRGKEAARFFTDSMSKPACELVVGEKIRFDGFSSGGHIEPTVWATVTEVLLDQPSNSKHLQNGVWVDSPNVVVIETTHGSARIAPTKMFRVAHTAEDKAAKIEAALAYQATLTKVGKPRKSKQEVAA